MSSAEALARQLADLERRLRAVERGSQMSRTSVEGGTLVVNDADGTPVLAIGQQDDGAYAVVGLNGGQVRADTVAQEVIDQITADLELADGAVTAAKLAAGAVTETAIADNAVTTPKLVAGAVQTLQLAADAVAAGKIAANAVTAREIAALAVTAAKIAAGAITADRLAVGVLAGNLIPDPSFESADVRAARDAASPWTFDTGSATARNHGAAFATVAGDATPTKRMWLTEPIATVAGDRYVGQFAVLALAGANGTVSLGYEATLQDGSTSSGALASATAAAAWFTAAGVAVAMPANTVSVRFYVQTAAQTAGTWCVDNVSVRRLVQGVEIADGAITAAKLSATAIDGKSITGATITGGVYQSAGTGNRLAIGEGVAAPTGTAAVRWTVPTNPDPNYSPYITAGFSEALAEFLELRSGSDATGRQAMVRLGLQAYIEAKGSGGISYAKLDPTAGITLAGPKLEFWPSGATAARPVMIGTVVTGTVSTNTSGIGTFSVASPGFGFTPSNVFVAQNGSTGSVAISMFYISGSATGTSFQIKAERNGAAFNGSVGVTAILLA